MISDFLLTHILKAQIKNLDRQIYGCEFFFLQPAALCECNFIQSMGKGIGTILQQ